ncbi:MAG TPA: FCD domain-containing protein [Arachnia sp.]|nr:FadR family transcriptional regulator [Propionibacteriaceae bacterium]HOA27366.1 FCD domain-containing protein [Arachnia sp.]HQD21983.1 FCD domain-containing protein [Arachnia sp.]
MVQKTSVSAVETARRGLCQLIATGELAAGAPLPSEAELCERFGVSRSSLREAQRMLAVAGALVARPGSSAAVSDMSARQILSGLDMVIPLLPLERYLELFTLREVLEGHASAQAAARMSDDEAAELKRVAHELAECEPSDRAQLLDTRFHTLISEAAGDTVLTALLDTIRRRGRDYRIFEDSAHHQLKHVSDAAHIEIAEAIVRRDPEGARALATHHVRVTRSWLEGIRPGPILFEHF